MYVDLTFTSWPNCLYNLNGNIMSMWCLQHVLLPQSGQKSIYAQLFFNSLCHKMTAVSYRLPLYLFNPITACVQALDYASLPSQSLTTALPVLQAPTLMTPSTSPRWPPAEHHIRSVPISIHGVQLYCGGKTEKMCASSQRQFGQ